MHALRALLAERVTTDVADRAWARGPRLPKHPDARRRHETFFQQLRNEGVVAIELSERARQIFPKVDEEVVLKGVNTQELQEVNTQVLKGGDTPKKSRNHKY